MKEAVKAAASRLLHEKWVDQVSLVEVAKAAEVARASLLLQFPQGWPEILFELYWDEFPYDETYDRMMACKSGSAVERVMRFLEPILLRGQQTGRLYPNIRGAMFTWGEEFNGIEKCWAEDCSAMIVELMTLSVPVGDEAKGLRVFRVAESLYYSTLDLASVDWRFGDNWENRRATLRVIIESAVVGLGLPNNTNSSLTSKASSTRQSRHKAIKFAR